MGVFPSGVNMTTVVTNGSDSAYFSRILGRMFAIRDDAMTMSRERESSPLPPSNDIAAPSQLANSPTDIFRYNPTTSDPCEKDEPGAAMDMLVQMRRTLQESIPR